MEWDSVKVFASMETLGLTRVSADVDIMIVGPQTKLQDGVDFVSLCALHSSCEVSGSSTSPMHCLCALDADG